MIDFLFIYEHKAREFDNLCLLAAELKSRGYTVEILNRFDYRNHNRYLFFNKPRVVGIVAAYGDVSLFGQVYQFCGKAKKILNFRWEQVFSEKDEQQGNESFFIPHGLAKDITHVCWGETPYKQLKSAGVKNAVITGAMQLDFLSDKLRSFYYSKNEIKKKYAINTEKVLEYISSFSYQSFTDAQLSREEQCLDTDILEMARNQRKLLETSLQWLLKYLDEHEDVTVVYRPHPAEDVTEILRQTAENNERFKIIREESVKQWIVTSDYVTTCMSTSIAEAYFAGKPVSILRPYPVDMSMDPVIYKNCRFSSTYEEFVLDLENCDKSFPVDESLIKRYYSVEEGNPAYVRVADLLVKMRDSSDYDFTDEKSYFIRIIRSALASMAIVFMLKTKNCLLINKIWPFTLLKSRIDEYEIYKHEISGNRETEANIKKLSAIIGENIEYN